MGSSTRWWQWDGPPKREWPKEQAVLIVKSGFKFLFLCFLLKKKGCNLEPTYIYFLIAIDFISCHRSRRQNILFFCYVQSCLFLSCTTFVLKYCRAFFLLPRCDSPVSRYLFCPWLCPAVFPALVFRLDLVSATYINVLVKQVEQMSPFIHGFLGRSLKLFLTVLLVHSGNCSQNSVNATSNHKLY